LALGVFVGFLTLALLSNKPFVSQEFGEGFEVFSGVMIAILYYYLWRIEKPLRAYVKERHGILREEALSRRQAFRTNHLVQVVIGFLIIVVLFLAEFATLNSLNVSMSPFQGLGLLIALLVANFVLSGYVRRGMGFKGRPSTVNKEKTSNS
jgi:hypothetical protein